MPIASYTQMTIPMEAPEATKSSSGTQPAPSRDPVYPCGVRIKRCNTVPCFVWDVVPNLAVVHTGREHFIHDIADHGYSVCSRQQVIFHSGFFGIQFALQPKNLFLS